MSAPVSTTRLVRKTSTIPHALNPVFKSIGVEQDDPEDVFEIQSKEGAGAFGRVFRAYYRNNPSRFAALKVIPIALEAGQRGEEVENVRREIQFLRECNHPNVVAFYGAYYKDGALWVAMEYCGGGSVGDVSRRRKLDEEEIAIIMRGALRGLAYLHSKKKIHRDIKGGNILLTNSGEVKIADFGVSAQLKDTMSRRGTFVGTPYWMSPEMIQDSDYDYKSDIWSLGITMIELADQKPPLFDEHPMRVLIQIPRNPSPQVKYPHLWSSLFSQFLQYCLQKDPKERPSALDCLQHPYIQKSESKQYVFANGSEVPIENPVQEVRMEISPVVPDVEVNATDLTVKTRPPPLNVKRPSQPWLSDSNETTASSIHPRALLDTPDPPLQRNDQKTPDNDLTSKGELVQKMHHVEEKKLDEELTESKEEEERIVASAVISDLKCSVTRQDQQLYASVDDSFDLPANVISKIQTLAGQSHLRRVSGGKVNSVTTNISQDVLRSGSGSLMASQTPSIILETTIPHELLPASSESPTKRRESQQGTKIHRDLHSFSRIQRGDGGERANANAETPRVGEVGTDQHNPLAEIESSTDRVHSLLSSLSSSSARLLQQQIQNTDSGMDITPSQSTASIPFPPIAPSSSISSSSHFIGTPFRVAHQVSIQYNTIDAKFEGAPLTSEWQILHKQFGIPLTQMRSRTSTTTNGQTPALLHMLRRELIQREGLYTKYIYRVSPDQAEILHAKTAINQGTFISSDVTDPHVFASLIKQWLRDLPAPLLGAMTRTRLEGMQTLVKEPFGPSGPLTTLGFALSFTDVHIQVQSFLTQFSSQEQNVLLWLIDHMLEVIDKSASNGMTAPSLAIVFAPSLYKWSSTTPEDAKLVSQQVATLLQLLLIWRQRCHVGKTEQSEGSSYISPLSPASKLDSMASKTESISERGQTLSNMLRSRTSLIENNSTSSISGIRELTSSIVLRRSIANDLNATHNGEIKRSITSKRMETDLSKISAQSMLEGIRYLVDSLWNELPQTLVVEDKPVIVQSLYTTFQRNVLSTIEQYAKRENERKWASATAAILETSTTVPGCSFHNIQHNEAIATQLARVPSTLDRKAGRWIRAALHIDDFVTLLQHQRMARQQIERLTTHGNIAGQVPPPMNPTHMFTLIRQTFTAMHTDPPAPSPCLITPESDQEMIESYTDRVLNDGAARLLNMTRTDQSPQILLAEQLAALGKQEPVMGNILAAWSEIETRNRLHLVHEQETLIQGMKSMFKSII